ncbi:hypothetical protein ABT354_01150 [Streptomyces sp. NPDC000594]|uniref:hypothetical protein n=1 Tax=Streptomyces sp. NPDC000594 TaxID=3154261 RepID=UPI00331EA9D0
MRASRALAVAAAVVAVTGPAAPAAVAGGDRQDAVHVSVSPHHVHQGATLTITVHGCGRGGGTISSNAFPHISLHRGGDGRGGDGRGGDGRGGDGRGGDGRGGDGRGENRGDERGEERGENRAGDRTDNRGGDGRDGAGRGGDGGGDGRGGDGRDTLSVGARIHDHAAPGRYNLVVRCDNTSNVATAQFIVVSGRGTRGGLGGSLEPDTAEMAVGAGLVATAAIGGTVFLARRRRTVGTRA